MTVQYAGFWRRSVAFFIDEVVLGLITGILLEIYFALNGVSAEVINPLVLLFLNVFGLLVVAFPYFSVCHYQWGCTLGKRLLKIRVVRSETFEPLGAGQAMARFLALFLSYCILCVGFFMAGWDSRKRSLHDRICSTVCIVRQ